MIVIAKAALMPLLLFFFLEKYIDIVEEVLERHSALNLQLNIAD